MPEPSLQESHPIHQQLVAAVSNSLKHLYDMWKEDGKISPVALSWPSRTIQADDGSPIDDLCALALPELPEERTHALQLLVERTNSRALLVREQHADSIDTILETPWGAVSWSIPIRRSGDVRVLGDSVCTVNTRCVGLLWRPNMAQA